MKFAAQIKWTSILALSKRGIRRIIEVGNTAAGAKWHRVIRPSKFKPAAKRKYNYTPRAKGYIKQKRKKLGHADPLVLSGDSREGAKTAVIRSTSKQVVVTYRNTRTFNRRPKANGKERVNMNREFEQTNDEDYRMLEGVTHKKIERVIQNINRTKIIRIR
jgi:hypothetical protein